VTLEMATHRGEESKGRLGISTVQRASLREGARIVADHRQTSRSRTRPGTLYKNISETREGKTYFKETESLPQDKRISSAKANPIKTTVGLQAWTGRDPKSTKKYWEQRGAEILAPPYFRVIKTKNHGGLNGETVRKDQKQAEIVESRIQQGGGRPVKKQRRHAGQGEGNPDRKKIGRRLRDQFWLFRKERDEQNGSNMS